MFIVDSNILIESKNLDYGFDICPGFWDLMRKAFESGLVISHDKVYREIRAGNDDLRNWVDLLPRTGFPKETDVELEVYLGLCGWVRSGRFRGSAVDQFCAPDYADPWICAKAKVEGLTLVTQEVSEPNSKRSVKIPDACIEIGVPYCNKYEMLRRLRARFVLDEAHSFAA